MSWLIVLDMINHVVKFVYRENLISFIYLKNLGSRRSLFSRAGIFDGFRAESIMGIFGVRRRERGVCKIIFVGFCLFLGNSWMLANKIETILLPCRNFGLISKSSTLIVPHPQYISLSSLSSFHTLYNYQNLSSQI